MFHLFPTIIAPNKKESPSSVINVKSGVYITDVNIPLTFKFPDNIIRASVFGWGPGGNGGSGLGGGSGGGGGGHFIGDLEYPLSNGDPETNRYFTGRIGDSVSGNATDLTHTDTNLNWIATAGDNGEGDNGSGDYPLVLSGGQGGNAAADTGGQFDGFRGETARIDSAGDTQQDVWGGAAETDYIYPYGGKGGEPSSATQLPSPRPPANGQFPGGGGAGAAGWNFVDASSNIGGKGAQGALFFEWDGFDSTNITQDVGNETPLLTGNNPTTICISYDGYHMYIGDSTDSGYIRHFKLTKQFDLTTASLVETFDLGLMGDVIRGVFISDNGHILYVKVGFVITQYVLTEPYSISSPVPTGTTDVGYIDDFAISYQGNYIYGRSSPDNIKVDRLTNPWDITTKTFTTNIKTYDLITDSLNRVGFGGWEDKFMYFSTTDNNFFSMRATLGVNNNTLTLINESSIDFFEPGPSLINGVGCYDYSCSRFIGVWRNFTGQFVARCYDIGQVL